MTVQSKPRIRITADGWIKHRENGWPVWLHPHARIELWTPFGPLSVKARYVTWVSSEADLRHLKFRITCIGEAA